ncbi:hypothetical protein RYH80_04765 [Halobaculum sp. MBLA0147]|uniref:hypothetical protein n=1 Tax=Halobaculum sp. MBLA0147 TaxID=3079934 RepID=UPI003526525A
MGTEDGESGDTGGADAERSTDEPASGDSQRDRLPTLTRRRALAGGAALGAGVLGAGALLDGGERPDTTGVDDDTATTLAAQFAPDLHFGAAERWFPTDPRRYTSERDGRTVVDGFDALAGYSADRGASDGPPAPTVFHDVVRYEGTDLVVVQYWLYSAFDQFTTNFHWHDWELLQVFVDAATEDPVLYVASAHSRRVPNNEYIDPATDRPSVIAEVGSHSSALGVNETRDTFERFAVQTETADVTNRLLDRIGVPLAYGLPRDEGFRLPFAVPELDGTPLFEHPELPDVDREDFVPASVTLRDGEVPDDLPAREPGPVLVHEDRTGAGASDTGDADAGDTDGETATGDADATYTLTPIEAVTEIDAFTGPQLRFEYPIPTFAEDAAASHLTSVGVPWEQPRFDDPIADVTEDAHRAELAARFDVGEPGPLATGGAVVTRLREATPTADAPGNNGVETREPRVEVRALLESESTELSSFRGVLAAVGVESGEHRLTVDAPGAAPYSSRFRHVPDGADTAGTETTPTDGTEATPRNTATTGGERRTTTGVADGGSPSATPTSETIPDARVTAVGTDGETVVTPSDAAVKFRAATSADGPDVRRVSITDDFGGRVYDALPDEDGRAAVYVHSAGAYTASVEDTEGRVGAYRVNPAADQATATVPAVETGVTSLTTFLETFLRETRAQVAAVRDGESVDAAVPADARDPAARGKGRGGGASATETEPGTDSPTATTSGRRTETATETPTETASETQTTVPTETTTATEADDDRGRGPRTATDTGGGRGPRDDGDDATTPTDTATPTATPTRTPYDTPTATPTDDDTNGDGSGSASGSDGDAWHAATDGSTSPPDPIDQVLRRLDNAIAAARNALDAIGDGNRRAAANRLGALRNQLRAIRRTLDTGRELPAAAEALLASRLDELDRRLEQAVAELSEN